MKCSLEPSLVPQGFEVSRNLAKRQLDRVQNGGEEISDQTNYFAATHLLSQTVIHLSTSLVKRGLLQTISQFDPNHCPGSSPLFFGSGVENHHGTTSHWVEDTKKEK